MQRAEIVIVGAGIIGLSIAWQLARRGYRDVLVLEKGAGLGEGSTGASSAVCRYRYSASPMIRLAKAGIESYRRWRDFTGCAQPKAQFRNEGVLWFNGRDPAWAAAEHQRLQALGIRTATLDGAALGEAFPALNPCTGVVDLARPDRHRCEQRSARHLLELDGGYMDPVDAAADLLDACRGAGVTLRFNTRVSDVRVQSGAINSVLTADGEELASACLVNAAGPWCAPLYAALGLDLPAPLSPMRIQMLHLDRTPALKGAIPICVDKDNGIYFRTQNRGQQLLVGSVREEDERETVADPDHYLGVADEQFRLEKLHLLQHRLPALSIDRSLRDYCGLYTCNLADVHPVIGAYGPKGFFVANGFSGHGFKLAPAVGAMMARLITGHRLPDEDDQDDRWLAPGRAPIATDSLSVLA